MFSHASEERFRELFLALRDDARLDGTFVLLMTLATVLASLGLLMNSASVIIGAMLLAPLMAPIVSLSMATLRWDGPLLTSAARTIGVGVLCVLLTSSLLALIYPFHPLTDEMLARLNPSLPDLGVAIASGLAAAVAKSLPRIAQNLAGVAIAVALVPPLSVAGLGLGWGDLAQAAPAFLLFVTNLAGIVMAAALSFVALGFSPLHRSTRSLAMMALAVVLVAVPLSLSFSRILHHQHVRESLTAAALVIDGQNYRVSSVTVREGQPLLLELTVATDDTPDHATRQRLKQLIEQRVGEPVRLLLGFQLRL